MNEAKTPDSGSDREAQLATEINDALRERIEKLNKAFKIGLIAGTVLCLIVVIYLGVLYSNFSDIVRTESLADFVSDEVSRRVPEVGREVEDHLKKEAPTIIAAFKTTLLNEAVPAISDMAQEQVYEIYDEMFQVAPKVIVDELFANMVKYNKDAIRAAMKRKGGMSDPESAAALEQKLIEETEKKLNRESKNQIAAELKQSVAALNKITTKLTAISKKRKLSKKEELMSRFISTWWTFLDSEKDKITDKEMKIVTEGLKDSTEEIFEGAKETIKTAEEE